MSVTLAASAAAILLLAVAVFQLALALGAPLGAYAWGGENEGVLPRRLRIGSAISAPLLVAMAAIVLIAAGLLLPEWQAEMSWAVWMIFLFMVINTAGNFRSASRGERRVMAPLTLVIAVLLLVVQLSGRSF